MVKIDLSNRGLLLPINLLVASTARFGFQTARLTSLEKKEYRQLYRTGEKRRAVTLMLASLKSNEKFMTELKTGFESTLRNKSALLIYRDEDPVQKLGIPDRILKMMSHARFKARTWRGSLSS